MTIVNLEAAGARRGAVRRSRLGFNALLGWWWADPVAGLLIATLAGIEAVRTWKAEALTDTCCG